MKTMITILLSVAIAVPATWLVMRTMPGQHKESAAGRKVLYYQSAMHPWIKSDQPGRCTICGMELTPVYDGEPGFDASGGGDVVALTQTTTQVLNVQTTEAQVRPLQKTLTVAGLIDDDATRHRVLSAYIPGRIEKLHVNFVGAEVKAGQPLAEFYSPALLQAEREYRTLSDELRAATAFRLRQMGLTPAQIEAIPQKPVDHLTSQILAPMGGTVVVRDVYEGQYVQEGEKLFEIADFSTMWFQLLAYEQDLPWLKPGLKVDVRTQSHPGKVFSGVISFIDPNLDPATRAAKVRVELPNPKMESGEGMLRHRLYAEGVVHLEAPEVLTVPRAAVIETGPEAVVYVDEGGGAYGRRVLTLGRRGDVLVEVLSGVKPGEKVVVNGNLLLDGQAEINRSFMKPAGHGPPGLTKKAVPLEDGPRVAIHEFVRVADAVSAALAKDDLAQFNKERANVAVAVDAVVAALKHRPEVADVLKHLSESRHLPGASDLAAARKAFHPFANAASRLLELLGPSNVDAFQVFECPMVDQAIPGVPKKGRWIQAAGRDLANPYFGAEMLECGIKVKL